MAKLSSVGIMKTNGKERKEKATTKNRTAIPIKSPITRPNAVVPKKVKELITAQESSRLNCSFVKDHKPLNKELTSNFFDSIKVPVFYTIINFFALF
jgi:hypothetical protein